MLPKYSKKVNHVLISPMRYYRPHKPLSVFLFETPTFQTPNPIPQTPYKILSASQQDFALQKSKFTLQIMQIIWSFLIPNPEPVLETPSQAPSQTPNPIPKSQTPINGKSPNPKPQTPSQTPNPSQRKILKPQTPSFFSPASQQDLIPLGHITSLTTQVIKCAWGRKSHSKHCFFDFYMPLTMGEYHFLKV